MKKTVAIPAKLQKAYLTDRERAELAKYGDALMTAEELAEIEAAQSEAKAAKESAKRQAEIDEIISQLAAIDAKSIRAIRAGEKDLLESYETQAQTLRDKIKEI